MKIEGVPCEDQSYHRVGKNYNHFYTELRCNMHFFMCFFRFIIINFSFLLFYFPSQCLEYMILPACRYLLCKVVLWTMSLCLHVAYLLFHFSVFFCSVCFYSTLFPMFRVEFEQWEISVTSFSRFLCSFISLGEVLVKNNLRLLFLLLYFNFVFFNLALISTFSIAGITVEHHW